MKRLRASSDDVIAALLLPRPRRGGHDVAGAASDTAVVEALSPVDQRHLLDPDEDVLFGFPRQRGASAQPRGSERPAPMAVPTALPNDLERDLASLAGIEPPAPSAPADDTDDGPELARAADVNFSERLLRVAQLVTVGAFVLMALAALLAARYGGGRSLHVHELPFALWGLSSSVVALALADVVGRTAVSAVASSGRRIASAVLMVLLLVGVTGVVASANGVAGPAWVLFLPIVLVSGAVAGPLRGLAIGAVAAACVYTAAGISHTMDVAGLGRLVVLLPTFPAAGWSAGALAGLARQAADTAQRRREALEEDVRALSSLLARVAGGDLSRVPAVQEGADPVTASMAVAFADTLLALRRLVRQMDGVADQLATRALDLAGTAEQDAAATESQVAAVAETTTTIEQLAATAGAIAETAVRVSQFAGTTRRDVDAGVRAVQESNLAMERIADRVSDLARRADGVKDRIGRIANTTRVIDELAKRTTVLAVNATIEAARAGEHGQGFTNVAAEIGTLAGRARAATARIAGIVAELEGEASATAQASQDGDEAVAVGAELQQDVVDALARIAAMVDRTTHASREITEATRQQRSASDAVVNAMSTVTEASDRYREGSRLHAEAAVRLRDLATALRHTLGGFKVR
ncbi:MAG TPA: methyl-accepting chemotaxis protein [Mycobacteriales bacterium]|nr:methyl-accepting chemotaxis protein [Mycobacteriales bacterium]